MRAIVLASRQEGVSDVELAASAVAQDLRVADAQPNSIRTLRPSFEYVPTFKPPRSALPLNLRVAYAGSLAQHPNSDREISSNG